MIHVPTSSSAGRRALAACCALVLLAAARDALAQQSPEGRGVAPPLEEIVVTSRKRAERLQDVPDSVFVLDEARLAASNVEGLRDFVDLTPNLLVRETFRSNETFLTMRGLASAQGALPPVAFVVDGVQLGSNDFINQDLLDVERIEVLRGPQGALYGQGAIAGAINVVTRRPTNDFEGFAKATYGNGDAYRLAGAVSGPLLADRLYARVSAYRKSSDGLIRNARGQRIDFSDETSVRGILRLETEHVDAQLRASHTSGDGSCCIQDLVPVDGAGNLVGVDDVENPGATSNVIGTSDDRFTDASLKVDVRLGGLTLTSISGYADVEQSIVGDGDFTAAPLTVQDITFATKVKNQELRLASDDAGRARWMVGAFYQDRRETQDIAVGRDTGAGQIAAPFLLRQYNVIESSAWATFGQLNYAIGDALEATLALRYDHDRQRAVDRRNPTSYREATFSETQPKVQLAYRWNPDLMFYASYGRGFRTGGFTSTVRFDNETTDNLEVGMKSTLFDGSMMLNASVFRIDYSNQQLSFVVLTPTQALRGVVNIPKTTIDGMELELAARASERLQVSAGIGVTNSVIRRVAPNALFGANIGQLVGNRSPLVPPFTFNASATYTIPVGADRSVVLHGDYRRLGGYDFDAQNTISTGTQDFVGGKVAFESGAWSVGVWGRNLTDARVATNVSATGSRLRIPNQPRSYGLEASYRF